MPAGPLDRVIAVRVGVLTGVFGSALVALGLGIRSGVGLAVLLIAGGTFGGVAGAAWVGRNR